MSKSGQQHTEADKGGQRPPKTSGKAPDGNSPAAKSPQKQQGNKSPSKR
jgi:hypothetical protein